MRDYDLRSYARVYTEFLDHDFCDQIVHSLNKISYQKHTFNNNKKNLDFSYEDDLDVAFTEIPQSQDLSMRVWSALEQYIIKDYADIEKVWGGWAGFTPIRFNRYQEGTQMHEHIDHIHTMFDGKRKGIPTLSIVGLLNDDYQGGEFVMWGNTVIDLPKGSILIFPSTFMYPHRVDAVRSGVRHSFVSWSF